MSKLLTELIGGAAAVTILAAWWGCVLTVLWSWFIVSTFAVPMLSIPAAIGLFLTVTMFKNTPVKNTNNVDRSFGETVTVGMLAPMFLLGIGWIVRQFMI